MNSVSKFNVHFDKEDLTFRDGEYITGFIELDLSDDLKYKSISFELRGYSVIYWNGISGSSPPDPTSADVFKEHCMEKCIMLDKIGNFLDKDPVLPAGEHVLPFEVKVPREVPSSFEGQYGRVGYEGRGVIERPTTGFKSNRTTLSRHDLVVLSALDLNSIPEASYKIEICKYKELGLCCTDGSLTIDWVVDRSGFVPTEQVLVNGSVQNDSKRTVVGSGVSLIMVVEYKLKKRRLIDRVRIAGLERGSIGTDDVSIWNDPLVVPSCPPSSLGRSKTVDVSYELEFKVTMEDGHASPIVYTKGVYVGTVPLAPRPNEEPESFTVQRPTLVATEVFLPCLAASGVVLTCPTRSADAPGFYGDRGGLGSSSPSGVVVEQEDVLLEDRPPPYAPGHNPFDPGVFTPAGGARGERVVEVVCTVDEPSGVGFLETLCIRGERSEASFLESACVPDADERNGVEVENGDGLEVGPKTESDVVAGAAVETDGSNETTTTTLGESTDYAATEVSSLEASEGTADRSPDGRDASEVRAAGGGD